MHEVTPAKTRQAVGAAVIGNVLEWYDFGLYAFVAIYISRNFFPQDNEVTALLSTFLAYGLGFVARPLGAIVIGRIGDTRGRKAALLLTILLMAVGTVLIGLLPTFEAIGYLAPVLLVVARLLQGFSAGGEWGSSTAFIVEWAPAGERGYYGSFQQTSVVAGLLWDHVGHSAVFLYGAAFAVIGSIALLGLVPASPATARHSPTAPRL